MFVTKILTGPFIYSKKCWSLLPIFCLQLGFIHSRTGLSQLKFGTTTVSSFFKWEKWRQKKEENSSSYSYLSQQFVRLARGMGTGLRCLKLQSKSEWGLGGRLMLGNSARAAVSGSRSRHTNYSEFDISRPRAATSSRTRSHFSTVRMEEGW
jgi:hypothetical protein